MGREGIDTAVLFSTIVSSFHALKTVDFESAMICVYHRWLANLRCKNHWPQNRAEGRELSRDRMPPTRISEQVHCSTSKLNWIDARWFRAMLLLLRHSCERAPSVSLESKDCY